MFFWQLLVDGFLNNEISSEGVIKIFNLNQNYLFVFLLQLHMHLYSGQMDIFYKVLVNTCCWKVKITLFCLRSYFFKTTLMKIHQWRHIFFWFWEYKLSSIFTLFPYICLLYFAVISNLNIHTTNGGAIIWTKYQFQTRDKIRTDDKIWANFLFTSNYW